MAIYWNVILRNHLEYLEGYKIVDKGQESSLFETVVRNGYDVGSGVLAAVNSEVRIELNRFGQFVTVYDPASVSIDDGALQTVSAMADGKAANESELAKTLFGSRSGMKHRETVGYYLDLYAGHVVEGQYRKNGSSGGFASWILSELVGSGAVDYVINVHPTYAAGGILYRYSISRTKEEIQSGSGSRYYPVELSGVLEAVKATPGRYAVVGIPSLIMEIRLLAESHAIFRERIRFTIGLICGHQKSTKYVESLAWQCGIKPGDLEYFNFRKKVGEGPASIYQMEMVGKVAGERVTIAKSEFELFGSNWGHGFFKAKFSDFTDDALNETADVSVGDAWLPEYVNDSDGNNIVIIRDEVILSLVRTAIEDGRLRFDRVDTGAVLKSQSGLIRHTRDEIGYRLAKSDKAGRWRPSKRLPANSRVPFLRRAVQDTREQIAELSHLFYQEALERDDWLHFERRMRPYVTRYHRLYALLALRNNELTPARIARQLIGRTAALRNR